MGCPIRWHLVQILRPWLVFGLFTMLAKDSLQLDLPEKDPEDSAWNMRFRLE